jgi:hypothetical protein
MLSTTNNSNPSKNITFPKYMLHGHKLCSRSQISYQCIVSIL